MTLTWTFLVLVVLALAGASAVRWRQGVAARERRALPRAPRPGLARPSTPDSDLGSLGLSPVRPAGTAAVPAPRAPEAAPRDWPADDTSPSWTFDTETATEPPVERPLAPAPEPTLRPDGPRPVAARAPAQEVETPNPAAVLLDDAERPTRERPRPAAASHDAPLTSARPAPAFVDPASPLWHAVGPAEHLLASLAACTAGTVAVLRHEGDRYLVDALAGLAVDAPPAPLETADGTHPLDRAPLDRFLSVLDGDGLGALTYLPPGAAQTALVRALDDEPDPRVLVAVTLAVGADHVDLATARLVGDYVDLLAALRTRPSRADDAAGTEDDASLDDGLDGGLDDTREAPRPTEAEAEPGPVGGDDPTDAPALPSPPRAPEPLPRSVILTGEINDARTARRDLAFALVTRADAESLLDGAPDAADTAEADLDTRLRAAPRVRRVEPFGPLLFGVFLDAAPDQVDPWARALSGTGPALHVGAVAPAGGHADAVRAAATAALEDAYARNVVCVVVD